MLQLSTLLWVFQVSVKIRISGIFSTATNFAKKFVTFLWKLLILKLTNDIGSMDLSKVKALYSSNVHVIITWITCIISQINIRVSIYIIFRHKKCSIMKRVQNTLIEYDWRVKLTIHRIWHWWAIDHGDHHNPSQMKILLGIKYDPQEYRRK